jgi:hypothetical protein
MSLYNILWNIDKNYIINTYNKENIFGNVSNNYIIEGIKIFPSIYIMDFFINYLFEPLIFTLTGLENNISFLNIECYNCEQLKMYCDWCSICNGILETAKENIIKNPELINTIDFKKINIVSKYLDFVLVNRKNKITSDEIDNFCIKTFGKITSKLLTISEIYLKTEQIELRWCPFKRSKEFYYRNKDKRFFTPNEENIYKIGKILTDHETITCNNCPNIINNNWKYKKNNTPSIFQPLLEYMLNNVNNPYKNNVNKKNNNYNKTILIIIIILFLILFLF